MDIRTTAEQAHEMLLEALRYDRMRDAAPDLYNALWEAVEISDRNLTEAGRTPECQKVYDLCLAALKKAEGE